MRGLMLVCGVVWLVAPGCDGGGGVTLDADGDVGADLGVVDVGPGDGAGVDLPFDAPADGLDDAGPLDAGPDGAPDALEDAGPDAVADGVADAEVSADAEPDTDVGPPLECPPEMVLVPAGVFIFGPGPIEAEVDLDAYCIDRTEVSAGAFLDCVHGDGCDGYDDWELCEQIDANTPQQCRPDRMAHPANYIDWFRAHAYCEWVGKRLPTPQEWEKAARGTQAATYPWGEEITCADAHVDRGQQFDICLGFGGLPDEPVPVDSYDLVPSPYGALNLVGNVREWVDNRKDPTMPRADEDVAMSKGGAWYEGENLVLPELRDTLLGPGITTQGHGFRCVATPK